MSEVVGFKVVIPKGLDELDFDRKPVMAVIRQEAAKVRQTSKRLVSAKKTSKPGEYPGRSSGLMRRYIRVKASKRRDRLWATVQVSTLPEKFWYPAVLNYGSEFVKPRRNPIYSAGRIHEKEVTDAITNALWKSLKGW